jgi:hypothetical protein
MAADPAPQPYPRTHRAPWFDAYARSAQRVLRRVARDADVSLAVTSDPFDAVLAHYTAAGGLERPGFAQGIAATLRARTGRDVQATYVVFDGAANPLRSASYVSVQHPSVVAFDPLEIHECTQIAIFRRRAGGALASWWRRLLPARDRPGVAATPDDWTVWRSATTDGIAWRLVARPGVETSEGPKGADTFWWETDVVRGDAFLMLIGVTVTGNLDWRRQPGVRRAADLERALDHVVEAIDHPSSGGDLRTVDAETVRTHPWVTIGDFLARARTVTLADRGLPRVHLTALDPAPAAIGLTPRTVAALAACAARVTDADDALRIWMGAPTLRLSLTATIDDAERDVVIASVVELGVALAAWGRDRLAMGSPPAR